MKHRFKNFVSLIIAVSMLLSLIPLTSTALDDEFEGLETLEEIPFTFELEPGDLPFEQLKDAVLSASDIPSCIDPALAEARGHVNRLYLQEPDDYTVMFQNRDGSKTVYVFSHPVKGSTIGTTAAIQVNNGLITFSGSNAIASLISELHDYNIGYCEIATLNSGILSADGINITADAREWARGESSASNLAYNMSSEAATEYNMSISENATATAAAAPGIIITPINPTPDGGITVMSISYSTLAGLMSFKNVSTDQYLTLTTSSSPSLTTNSSIIDPYSRWYVQYDSYYGYIVSNYSNVSNTYLGFDDMDEFIIDSMSPMAYYMTVSIESTANSIITISCDHLAISSTGALYEKSIDDVSFPESCQWEITNKYNITFVSRIDLNSNTRVEQSGVEFYLDYTVTPSNANTYEIGLYNAEDNQEITHDTEAEEDEYAYYIDDPGVYTVYYKDSITGVKSANFTLIIVNPITGIYADIASIKTFGNKKTYSIQPVGYNSKYLTMNVSNSGTTTISVGEYNPTLQDTNIYEDWSTLSRLFTIDSVSNSSPKYKITSILTKSQYSYPNESNVHTNSYSGSEYNLTYSTSKQNALYLPIILENQTSADVSMSFSSEVNSTLTILPIEDYYVIFATSTDSNNILNNPALKYDANGGSSTVIVEEFNPNDESFRWKINERGVDAPLIMQTQLYTCGPATFLQVLYGKGLGESVTDTQNNQTNCLHKKMMKLVNRLPYQQNSDGSYGTVNTMFDDHINYYYFSNRNTSQCYIRWEKSGTENDIDYYKNKITNSLTSGWAPFAHTSTGGTPYKQSEGGAHYICIIGYEEYTVNNVTESFVIIANCHYDEDILGIYAIPLDEFCQKTDILYYYIP